MESEENKNRGKGYASCDRSQYLCVCSAVALVQSSMIGEWNPQTTQNHSNVLDNMAFKSMDMKQTWSVVSASFLSLILKNEINKT